MSTGGKLAATMGAAKAPVIASLRIVLSVTGWLGAEPLGAESTGPGPVGPTGVSPTWSDRAAVADQVAAAADQAVLVLAYLPSGTIDAGSHAGQQFRHRLCW